MQEVQDKKSTSWLAVFVLIVGMLIATWYIVFTMRGISLQYEAINQLTQQTHEASRNVVELPNGTIVAVPTLEILSNDRPWMYVSDRRTLGEAYEPSQLVDITVPTAASEQPMKLRPDVSRKLSDLFEDARNAGYELMVSSAYRSVQDQADLYQEIVALRGAEQAERFVLQPGSSEHHTGFAVDLTDASSDCELDANACNLSPSTAAYIAEVAPNYGFIIRYPEFKRGITGIDYEPWHLRYVGVGLAKALSSTELTLDEFIEIVAPGRLSE